jgi:hypothetical protein
MSGRQISYGRGGAGESHNNALNLIPTVTVTVPIPPHRIHPTTPHHAGPQSPATITNKTNRQHNPPTERPLTPRPLHPNDQTRSLHNRPRWLRKHGAQRPRPARACAREPRRRVAAVARSADSPPHWTRYDSVLIYTPCHTIPYLRMVWSWTRGTYRMDTG